jgi:hypothetical protein
MKEKKAKFFNHPPNPKLSYTHDILANVWNVQTTSLTHTSLEDCRLQKSSQEVAKSCSSSSSSSSLALLEIQSQELPTLAPPKFFLFSPRAIIYKQTQGSHCDSWLIFDLFESTKFQLLEAYYNSS